MPRPAPADVLEIRPLPSPALIQIWPPCPLVSGLDPTYSPNRPRVPLLLQDIQAAQRACFTDRGTWKKGRKSRVSARKKAAAEARQLRSQRAMRRVGKAR